MFERILSILFPPRLPGCVSNWGARVEYHFDEQGSAGPVKSKRYRNGIERHFEEEKTARFHGSLLQMSQQMRHGQEWMRIQEQNLIRQGYINTIHDCWEHVEK